MLYMCECVCESVDGCEHACLILLCFISASVPLPEERNDTLELENQQRLIKTLETITNRLKSTLNKEPMYSFQLASETVVADSNSLETEKAFLFCRPGSVLRGRMCGKTPLGPSSSLCPGSNELGTDDFHVCLQNVDMEQAFCIVVWSLLYYIVSRS
jgi:hypothetical protein